jgi:hypothetical protein
LLKRKFASSRHCERGEAISWLARESARFVAERVTGPDPPAPRNEVIIPRDQMLGRALIKIANGGRYLLSALAHFAEVIRRSDRLRRQLTQ